MVCHGAVELDAEGCTALSDWVSHVHHALADSAVTCGHLDGGQLWCRDDVVELLKDDLYVVRYNPIKDLLRDNWVELI